MVNTVSGHEARYFGPKAGELAELYAQFLRDTASVDAGWQSFFSNLEDDAKNLLAGIQGASPVSAATQSSVPMNEDESRKATLDSIRALMLIRAYRVRGHLEANLDPLGLKPINPHPELDPLSYGFLEADMDRPIFINGVLGLETASLRQIVERVRKTYCGKIGVEFMHIQEPEQKAWIQERIEGIHNRTDFTVKGKQAILERLTAAETFEQFLGKKYTGTKRFGLDGAETMIPALEQILKRGSALGLDEVVLGVAHRGRLNILANLMGKPFRAIFNEFKGGAANPEDVGGSGDVKYHLGTSSDREFDGNTVHLSLTANPSHLEAVDPVVVGKVRAKQDQKGDHDFTRTMGLLLHGDAAFAGQGLVPETLDLSELEGYQVGGTIHFIVNNQIGFTTDPVDSRSGPYCTDVAKAIQAPIIHVNGDDPEAVVHAARIAIEFRQTFKKDIVIDMFCYRRFGHNEGDEPTFTQPQMYKKIAQQKSVRELYAAGLSAEGAVTQSDIDGMAKTWWEKLEEEFEAAESYKPNKADWFGGVWSHMGAARGYDARRGNTGVELDLLKEVGNALCKVPEGFNIHRKIARQLKTKQKMIDSGEGIDWATAEALAYGTLVVEGHPVRLSGQDCNRGTFSQRHAAWIDQKNEDEYKPLNNIRPSQAHAKIINSPLSELAVLGFEYGYSLAEPDALVLWEAQFGDFVNGAQIIIDQFIVSGESKWLRMCGLVMLLPHGYEGQGPEHSSGRVERFLQSCAEDNIQVVNCTTPANYFHVLRRQIHRGFRKPLIVMTPKSLLRHKSCVSKLEDMLPGTSFHRVLPCEINVAEPSKVKQVVLCSGKVYYDLLEERETRGIDNIHIIRLEQLYPFPAEALSQNLAGYEHCDLVWCQEEPRNMGGWSFVSTFIEEVAEEMGFKNFRPRYAGRKTAASPATGSARKHVEQQAALLDDALTIGKKAMSRIQTRKAEELEARNAASAKVESMRPVAKAGE
ncbi:2-oxoglutarate dehydrogenase E1 component [Kiloniella laminariae]|uniref:2-oxoglutarate dehydrogenase E1 component n=1 Tax=Kiloniella laminariae TaxID=454162 RepID=A0ABT4LMZ4_9PROT|nr:2-oxoglutarate dehydrogenase E1 component [Kiloniella laminariae]MCZ4282441.1 2-oxoglutarate dehydrogenase E1 component [Kiloniella laminariae]